jgi:HEAT repeat protein
MLVGAGLAFAFWVACVPESIVSCQEVKKSAGEDRERLYQIRLLLWRNKTDELKKLGSAANDVYLTILKDPASEPDELTGTLDILAEQKGDRSQFLSAATSLVSHEEAAVRLRAALLIGRIGASAEAHLLIPLLADENEWVQTGASEALAKIGTLHELEVRFPKFRGDEVNGVDSTSGVHRWLVSASPTPPSSRSRPSG